MAVETTHIAQFAVATVYFALACWLLFLDFSRTINRILAVLFFLRGIAISLNQMVTLDGTNALYWHSTRVYFFIATSFAILDFLVVYTWRADSPARRGARRFLLGTLVALEIIYVLDHAVVATLRGDNIRFGPLGAAFQIYAPMFGVAAIWFAWISRNTSVPVQAKFHSLVSLGLAVAALAEIAGMIASVAVFGTERVLTAAGTGIGAVAAQVTALSALPFAFLAVGILAFDSVRANKGSRAIWQASIALSVVAVPLLTRIFAGADSHSYVLLSAVPRMIAPTILTYALVRQVSSGLDVFRLDLRAGAAVRRGTVGGILIAFFFVVSESAAQLFSQFAATQDVSPIFSQLLGIVGAGVLLVFLHPLNRLGERLSKSVLPNAKPLSELGDRERLRIYEEQVQLAWSDGSITRKERLLLDKLREQLRLPLGAAVTLESRVAGRAPG